MPGMGLWVIHGETLIQALRRTHEGEDPDIVYAELYANADLTNYTEEDKEP